ncbi:MAG TPA: family 10 glycosylhydrolase [Chitinophagaceae bacterium]|nr:MAG: hypothetical protein UZ11_BCD004002021 [Bacteroidetes bacterium OLB11]HMN33152.1 family 10 glycosylhydrolase [Chitinophagaceae bacterium]
MTKNKCIIILSFLLFWITIELNSAPKREFRAVWVATVGNIDWPSKQGINAEIQRQEFISLLDKIHANNMNAVIVQIRPSADALYKSNYEDWSRYLSGKQGEPPTPYYDPLEFMIEECHKRCIEFHAWFNPYRALVDATKNPNSAQHVTKTHPEWFVNYGNKKYFDPGLPEVREYFTKIVVDVVKRYDIDAVHFDDYFYPYRIAKVEFPDQNSFAKYGKSFQSKDDWRRDNVDKLIEKISKEIKSLKPYVKFGISPFGVWRNSSKDPEGSNTNGGQTNYDDLFANVIMWQQKGWIDYLLPQLYWEIGFRAADYLTLLNWWGEHSYNRHIYIGHGAYRLATDNKICWKSLDELERQINYLRKNIQVQGSAFYSAKTFVNNIYNINETMREKWYKTPALLPTMDWLPKSKIPTPKLTLSNKNNQINSLTWSVENDQNNNLQYVVYRFNKNEKIDISNPEKIITITKNLFYNDSQNQNKYQYVVTALDRLHNEGTISNIVE